MGPAAAIMFITLINEMVRISKGSPYFLAGNQQASASCASQVDEAYGCISTLVILVLVVSTFSRANSLLSA